MKSCTKCGELKPLSEFGKHRLSKDGHAYRCKACARKHAQNFRKNPSGIYTQIKSRLKFGQAHFERRGIPKTISISRENFVKWYNVQHKICVYCDIPEDKLSAWNNSHNNKVQRLTIDCIDNDLGYAEGNLVLACLRCNGIKSDIFDHEIMREIGQKYIKPIWKKEVTKVNENG